MRVLFRHWQLFLMLLGLPMVGCARGGDGTTPGVPDWTLRFVLDFLGPVDDTSFYFIAIDADGDFGDDGPLPVAAGPFWGNGWGTGSITHFISYSQGKYDVYKVDRTLQLVQPGGGIVEAAGSPDETDTGQYELTVGQVTPGAATVEGVGSITTVTNKSDQNAGRFTLETDAQGRIVGGSVSFTPAADGGREPNPQEQAALDALNAGGMTLAANSLATFGLRLGIGSPTAGQQTIDVAPAVAEVKVVFRPSSTDERRTSTGTLTANSNTPTATPPIPGARLRTRTLRPGGVALLRSDTATTATLIGLPYESSPPLGGNSLDVTIDLADLGPNVANLSVNFISTTELIFDPTMTDPDQHVYDGLGRQGNSYISFSVRQTRTILNSDSLPPERANDPTLEGPATQAERDAVDLIDWAIYVERLGG
ncbi:MAG: hypothetical protein ACUVX8_12155 [Candidatus Zipacnadales bacterium]